MLLIRLRALALALALALTGLSLVLSQQILKHRQNFAGRDISKMVLQRCRGADRCIKLPNKTYEIRHILRSR